MNQPATFAPSAPGHVTASAGFRLNDEICASFVVVNGITPLPSADAVKISLGRVIELCENTRVLPSALTLMSLLKPSPIIFLTGPPVTETEKTHPRHRSSAPRNIRLLSA